MTSPCEDLDQVFAEIARLGLTTHLAQLEAYGFTVVPNLLSEATVRVARDVILDIAERQTGTKPDLATGAGHEHWRLIPYLLVRHPIFQEILLNERMLALVTYLVGQRCQLSSMSCHFKGYGRGGELSLHTDTWMPAPLPRYSHVTTVNFALVEYSREGGALAIVPGSHTRARNPLSNEKFLSGPNENKEAVAIEMQPGSMAIWHGNTWHGSYPRMIPGLRLNLSLYFVRPWMKVMEAYGPRLPADVLARYGDHPRFRQLAGLDEVCGWCEEGPPYLNPKANVSVFSDDDPTEQGSGLRLRYGKLGWHS